MVRGVKGNFMQIQVLGILRAFSGNFIDFIMLYVEIEVETHFP